MADLAFPAGAVLSAWAMGVDPSGREVRRSRWTRKRSVTVHAAGGWLGSFTLALVDRRDRATAPDVAARINAWVAALVAGESTDLPLPPTTPTIGTTPPALQVTAVSDDDDLTLSAPHTFRDGDLFKVRDRVYQVRQPALGAGMSVDTVRVVPYGQSLRRGVLVGSRVEPADRLEVYAREDLVPSEDPSFSGPWVVPWEEAV